MLLLQYIHTDHEVTPPRSPHPFSGISSTGTAREPTSSRSPAQRELSRKPSAANLTTACENPLFAPERPVSFQSCSCEILKS